MHRATRRGLLSRGVQHGSQVRTAKPPRNDPRGQQQLPGKAQQEIPTSTSHPSLTKIATSVGEDVGKPEPVCSAAGMEDGAAAGRTGRQFLKSERPHDGNSTSRRVPRRSESDSRRDTWRPCSRQHYSYRLQHGTSPGVRRQRKEHTKRGPTHSGIVFSHKKGILTQHGRARGRGAE